MKGIPGKRKHETTVPKETNAGRFYHSAVRRYWKKSDKEIVPRVQQNGEFILDALIESDEFLLNLQIRLLYGSSSQTSRNPSRENQEPTEDRSQIDPNPKPMVFFEQKIAVSGKNSVSASQSLSIVSSHTWYGNKLSRFHKLAENHLRFCLMQISTKRLSIFKLSECKQTLERSVERSNDTFFPCLVLKFFTFFLDSCWTQKSS